jgi:histidine ammonia-lyase
VQHVIAIELMCAAQGLDHRAPLRAGVGARRAHEAVRALVRPLERDRVLGGDIETLADAVASGAFTPVHTVALLAGAT